MSTGGPDLFVICKSCGSEVSPYITECPYCGNRLRKRAPKLDRNGRIAERASRRPPSPSLPRLRRGEIPGIRHDSHPYVTIALVVAGIAGCLVWRTNAVSISQLVVFGHLGTRWWRALTAPFIYNNTGYAFVSLSVIALYGTLLERRHGPVLLIALYLLGGAVGMALAGQFSNQVALGGNGIALALLTAWAMQDVVAVRQNREVDGDLLGTAVLGVVVALMPLAAPEASWICAGAGVAAGALVGYPLARIHPV
ncbi:MAG TPA: rhomboid family intramembrane serine protease [Solirubrobacteraceae bacterium]